MKSWEHFRLIDDYFTKTWLPELKRWSHAYRPDDLFKCNTNNGTERLNETLKYKYLNRFQKHSFSRLITILIEKFIPERYESYVKKNIQYTSLSKLYDEDIPTYMKDRPGPLVDDMMDKRGRVTEFMISSVHPVIVSLSKTYWVESISEQSNERNCYIVRFGDQDTICSCNCGSFKHHRILCKHFFAVFESGKGCFDDISPIYLNHPYTSIDMDVLGGAPLRGNHDEVNFDHPN